MLNASIAQLAMEYGLRRSRRGVFGWVEGFPVYLEGLIGGINISMTLPRESGFSSKDLRSLLQGFRSSQKVFESELNVVRIQLSTMFGDETKKLRSAILALIHGVRPHLRSCFEPEDLLLWGDRAVPRSWYDIADFSEPPLPDRRFPVALVTTGIYVALLFAGIHRIQVRSVRVVIGLWPGLHLLLPTLVALVPYGKSKRHIRRKDQIRIAGCVLACQLGFVLAFRSWRSVPFWTILILSTWLGLLAALRGRSRALPLECESGEEMNAEQVTRLASESRASRHVVSVFIAGLTYSGVSVALLFAAQPESVSSPAGSVWATASLLHLICVAAIEYWINRDEAVRRVMSRLVPQGEERPGPAWMAFLIANLFALFALPGHLAIAWFLVARP